MEKRRRVLLEHEGDGAAEERGGQADTAQAEAPGGGEIGGDGDEKRGQIGQIDVIAAEDKAGRAGAMRQVVLSDWATLEG